MLEQLNRRDRRTVESILSHRTTSEHERRVLVGLGVRHVAKRAGRVITPDIPVDCYDEWREHVDRVFTMFTREPRVRQVHPARRPSC